MQVPLNDKAYTSAIARPIPPRINSTALNDNSIASQENAHPSTDSTILSSNLSTNTHHPEYTYNQAQVLQPTSIDNRLSTKLRKHGLVFLKKRHRLLPWRKDRYEPLEGPKLQEAIEHLNTTPIYVRLPSGTTLPIEDHKALEILDMIYNTSDYSSSNKRACGVINTLKTLSEEGCDISFFDYASGSTITGVEASIIHLLSDKNASVSIKEKGNSKPRSFIGIESILAKGVERGIIPAELLHYPELALQLMALEKQGITLRSYEKPLKASDAYIWLVSDPGGTCTLGKHGSPGIHVIRDKLKDPSYFEHQVQRMEEFTRAYTKVIKPTLQNIRYDADIDIWRYALAGTARDIPRWGFMMEAYAFAELVKQAHKNPRLDQVSVVRESVETVIKLEESSRSLMEFAEKIRKAGHILSSSPQYEQRNRQLINLVMDSNHFPTGHKTNDDENKWLIQWTERTGSLDKALSVIYTIRSLPSPSALSPDEIWKIVAKSALLGDILPDHPGYTTPADQTHPITRLPDSVIIGKIRVPKRTPDLKPETSCGVLPQGPSPVLGLSQVKEGIHK